MQESIYFVDYRWPELKEFAEKNAILILPVGQVEEHGPHLPVGTDLMISQHTAERVDMSQAVDEPVRSMSRFVGPDIITRHHAKVFWSTWRHSGSKTGTYGCPTKASREKGEAILEGTVGNLLELMREIRDA
jgi:creatinine amidohydrolase/Fe(II)-dependent formamide hydrolase-like protein